MLEFIGNHRLAGFADCPGLEHGSETLESTCGSGAVGVRTTGRDGVLRGTGASNFQNSKSCFEAVRTVASQRKAGCFQFAEAGETAKRNIREGSFAAIRCNSAVVFATTTVAKTVPTLAGMNVASQLRGTNRSEANKWP